MAKSKKVIPEQVESQGCFNCEGEGEVCGECSNSVTNCICANADNPDAEPEVMTCPDCKGSGTEE